MSLFGPYLAACMLLVVAGCAKATRPHDTARALVGLLQRLRFGLALLAVRTFALGETALGLFAIFLPGPVTAALVSGCYASFALVVAFLRHRDVPLSSCGCFAERDTMPTGLHVAIDAGSLSAPRSPLRSSITTSTRSSTRWLRSHFTGSRCSRPRQAWRTWQLWPWAHWRESSRYAERSFHITLITLITFIALITRRANR